MPLNGSGTFAAPASTWNPATTNTTINSTDWTALLADITTALSTAMYKDGQATPTANIPMGGFKLTGLAAGTLVSDAVRVSQVQNSSFTSLTTVAGTNTITATATPTPAAYVVGQVFEGIAAATNTAAATLNISSLGAGAVQVAGTALTGGEIIINGPFRVMVSAVTPVFQLIANGQVAPFLDTNALVKGSADGTKKIRFEVDGLTTGTTRVLTVADIDSAIGKQPTRQVFTSGSGATYTTPAGATRINVRVVGGGAGGGGGGTGPGNGTAGNASSFSTLSANGGAFGSGGAGGGAGGTASGGDTGLNLTGGAGMGGAAGQTGVNTVGGIGGGSIYSGAGTSSAGGNGTNANGYGSGGGAGGSTNTAACGGGGGAGGYCEKLITAPAATYTYTVGAAANGGSAGTAGGAGGNGSAGVIVVDEYYN